MDLSGKVAFVTGGAQGIGRAIVERFVAARARAVLIADVQDEAAAHAAREIAPDGHVLAVQTDVSDEASVNAAVQQALNAFGRIDILINNAGVCPVVLWDNTTVESWNHILAVNVTGQYICTRAVLPQMRAQRYGRIVFISSEAAFYGSIIAHVAYGVSKAGVLALMKSVAKGFAAEGIRANAIAPGPVDTPLSHTLGADFWTSTEERTLLKRHAAALEIADAALFLVSESSSYMTGQVLRVNGGADLA